MVVELGSLSVGMFCVSCVGVDRLIKRFVDQATGIANIGWNMGLFLSCCGGVVTAIEAVGKCERLSLKSWCWVWRDGNTLREVVENSFINRLSRYGGSLCEVCHSQEAEVEK